MSFEYWYLFPISVLIATTAMASGVEGATFFAPLFLLGLKLPPEVAIGTGLITEVFGFASGLFSYARKRLIDLKLGGTLLAVSVPAALLGTWLSGSVPPEALKAMLGLALLAVALSFLKSPDHGEVARLDGHIGQDFPPERARTCLRAADGEEICYTVCNRTEGGLISGVGGLFIGMLSTGLGELNGYFLLRRCRVPSRVSVATGVFVVAVTALAASAGHVVRFVESGPEVLNTVLSLLIFTVPGVVVGGQIGSAVADRIPQRLLERGLGVLFILIAALMLGTIAL